MPDPRYATPEYRAAYRAVRKAQARGEWLWCAQPVCLEPSREIAPNQQVDVAHDDDGLAILGPAHRRCNRVDGGKRRHLLDPSRATIKRRVL